MRTVPTSDLAIPGEGMISGRGTAFTGWLGEISRCLALLESSHQTTEIIAV